MRSIEIAAQGLSTIGSEVCAAIYAPLAVWRAARLTIYGRPVAFIIPAFGMDGLGDRDSEPVWILYRDKLNELAGRDVTDYEVDQITKALEFSSIPEALGDVVAAVCGLPDDEEDEEDA